MLFSRTLLGAAALALTGGALFAQNDFGYVELDTGAASAR